MACAAEGKHRRDERVRTSVGSRGTCPAPRGAPAARRGAGDARAHLAGRLDERVIGSRAIRAPAQAVGRLLRTAGYACPRPRRPRTPSSPARRERCVSATAQDARAGIAICGMAGGASGRRAANRQASRYAGERQSAGARRPVVW